MSEAEKLIEVLAQEVDGLEGDNRDILILTLSSCQWCRRCKRYLNDRNVKYKYIDVDRIDSKDKATILDYLRNNFQERVSYPFLIHKKGVVVGFNPSEYDKILEGDEQ